MVERISLSAAEAATEGALTMTGLPTFAGHTNGVWVGDIKMFRSLEQRDLMQFVDYQKDRVRRSRITRMPDEPRSRS